MTRARNVPLITAIAATAIVLGLLALHAVPGLETVEGFTIDARFALRGRRPPASDRVVLVGLDDATRARFPETFQTRRGYAALIRALTRYDAKLIALDLFFSAPEVILPEALAARVRTADLSTAPPEIAKLLADLADELRGDELLAAAIAESHRTFLGAYFREVAGASAREPPKLQLARHGESADAGGGGARRPIHATTVDFTLDGIARGAIGAGAVNSFRDPDGVTRRVPLAIEFGGNHYMPLGLAVALADLGKPGDTTYLVGDDVLLAGGRALAVGPAASLELDVLGRDELPRGVRRRRARWDRAEIRARRQAGVRRHDLRLVRQDRDAAR